MMDDFQVIKANEWQGKKSLGDFVSDYSVYPDLTEKLDSPGWSFNDAAINEIVLWKLGRYVKVPNKTLTALDGLKNLKQGEHQEASEELTQLLACNGVRLPMASTILRFANPDVFQIYDRHICRALFGTFDSVAPKAASKALNCYWEFLDELISQCVALKIPFIDSDRILFEFDKQVNPPLSGNNT